MDDVISRHDVIEILQKLESCIEYDVIGAYFDTDKAEQIINKLPSAQKTQLSTEDTTFDSVMAEIEEEYQKAVNTKWIHKPLAKALYEVWKKHDREDVSRHEGRTG